MTDNADAKHVLDTMRAHRTVRSYASNPVDEAHVHEAVAAAQCAATSSNVQGYSLLRIRNAETRERLAELAGNQRQVAEAGALFCVCADQRRHRLIAEDAGRDYVGNLETFLVDVVDASLFAQNLTLAFEALGYGTCYIGGLRTRLPEVDELLGLPSDVFPLYGLCVGVAADDPGVRPRLPVRAVLLDERYPSDDAMRAQIAEYDRVMEDYNAARGKPGYDWSGGTARRFSKAERQHLHAYYTAKGARLE